MFSVLFSSFATAQPADFKAAAKHYREKGYTAQANGDVDTAMSYYQKAIELDPTYAVAYNDLGVLYELKGFQDRAEESYLKCLKINPKYQSAYFNLANLYEEKGDLNKAAGYWKKRIEIGDPNEPWTRKAKERLQNIGLVSEEIRNELKEQEKKELIKSISRQKDMEDKDLLEADSQKTRARKLFKSATANYSQGNYAASLKESALANALDPANSDIEKLMNKAQEKIRGAYSQ